MDDARLEQLYDRVSTLDCKRLCAQSCTTGPIRMGRREYERITERLGYAPKGNPATWICPLLKDGLCTVHDIRPLICRLWGTTHKMSCSHGCKPARWMGEGEASALLDEVYADGISYDLWGEAEYWEGKQHVMDNKYRDYLAQKRKEYEEAYMSALATANANHGAMQAIEDALAEMDRQEREAQAPAGPEVPNDN